MTLSKKTAEQLLTELGLRHLNPKKREKVLAGLEEHFSRVIFVILLSKISNDQFARLKQALGTDRAEDEIQKIASEVPGLAQIIEQRIKQEFEILKTVMK